MSKLTTGVVTIATLLVLAGGAAVGFGASGPATGTADLAAQETTTTQGNGTATQGNDTATHLEVRNATVERVTMRNVTVLDARFEQLTLVNTTGENATNRTYRNVTVDRIEATGFLTDLTVENASIRNETLASALINESGRQRIETRLVMGRAVLRNQTVSGLAVENATVYVGAAGNVSLSQAGDGGATATDAAGQTGGPPALSAEAAVVENFSLTTFESSGVSFGDGGQNATTATAQTTVTTAQTTVTTAQTTATTTQSTATTTATTEATVIVNTTTAAPTTTPAEAGSQNVTDGNETNGDQTDKNQTDEDQTTTAQ